MASNGVLSMGALIVTFFIGFASSSFISDEVLNSHRSTGRSLLQAKKSCPVNFEFQNYTIITSQCKGPTYPAKQCCAALIEFACPFADELNDSTNECASTMFSYININGKYPPGLFASECKGDKNGLPCPATNSTSQSDKAGATAVNSGMLSLFGFILFCLGVLLL
ncbi:GPI-anchored protein LORELEI [Rhynchospora pubera]|uniref:GPI-anchored protein LORELEI n=1 Tax=Rhynchospora pubera TaxID=906938 RepID=A0AAV8BWF6_9POAL|nr:GPI-anchored protein LORELEI [Rhynchospora pubera]KAJ4799513.1 GPI-anchored protein LORELEI [Rhynchospora pubera]KAJ4811138.1 GPI-anchored protein LORELEI [Rhynchospora pubera]